ncbi:MAG TPA: hypothetical protein VFB68_07700 [Xanthobacteraceae bacterium]|nr:hypothetical protein [Xanthobacteraceae bacterium]
MTTVGQVRQVVQPLLQRNPDLTLIGRLVVIKPVHHVLRAVYIERSSDPGAFIPIATAIFLFKPRKGISLHWGLRVYRGPVGSGTWDVGEPQTSASMCEAIEAQALPPLRSIKTIDDFVAFTSKDRFPDTFLYAYEDLKIYIDVARGDFDAARSICEHMATDRAKRTYLPDMQEEYDRITKELCPLVAANDRPGLARLLHGYEAQSVKNLKIEKLWEPTPFPIES